MRSQIVCFFLSFLFSFFSINRGERESFMLRFLVYTKLYVQQPKQPEQPEFPYSFLLIFLKEEIEKSGCFGCFSWF